MTRYLSIIACLLAAGCSKDTRGAERDAEDAPTAAIQDQAEPEAPPPTIVFLGDSLTAGMGLAADEAMPALVQAKLDAAGAGYRVINAGRSGDTTAGGLSRLPWYLRDTVNLHALVIGLGSNDAMRGLSLEQLEQNLREIIRQVRAYDSDVDVFLFQMLTFPNMGKQYAGAYEAVFARVAREEDVVLLPFPLEGVAGEPSLNQHDGIHPTAEGARVVADNVYEALEPHL